MLRFRFVIGVAAALSVLTGHAMAADSVAFAGFAYAGEAAQVATRFPVTRQVEAELTATGNAPGKLIGRALAAHPPANFTISSDGMASLKQGDQALATALVITSEFVSAERFGQLYKVMANVRGQVMVFDFKAMTVLRAYPLNATYLDVLDHAPGDKEKRERIKRLLIGGEKPGLFDRYAQVLAAAKLPASGMRYLQVSQVNVAPEARAQLPDSMRGAGVAEGWAADMFGEALLDRASVPVLPYTKGYAIGNAMAMRFADGEVFNLKLPEPDYTIGLDIKGMKRVEYGTSSAGASYIYAVYSHVKLGEPLSGKQYLNADFKNGEVKVVPATQVDVDHFPAYADSFRGLFTKLSGVLGGQDSDWLAAAASGDSVDKQVEVTRGVLNSCR